jgi:hypothetical protein
MDIRIYETKEGRKAIEIADLIEMLSYNANSEQARTELIEKIILAPDFEKAFANVVGGYSNEEWHAHDRDGIPMQSSDKIRALVAQHADSGARELIKLLTERIQYLVLRLQDAKRHGQALLDQWPDAFKKYIPKELVTYEYIDTSDSVVTRMLDYVKQQPAPK